VVTLFFPATLFLIIFHKQASLFRFYGKLTIYKECSVGFLLFSLEQRRIPAYERRRIPAHAHTVVCKDDGFCRVVIVVVLVGAYPAPSQGHGGV
jgi:hypothetical protein